MLATETTRLTLLHKWQVMHAGMEEGITNKDTHNEIDTLDAFMDGLLASEFMSSCKVEEPSQQVTLQHLYPSPFAFLNIYFP